MRKGAKKKATARKTPSEDRAFPHSLNACDRLIERQIFVSFVGLVTGMQCRVVMNRSLLN